MSKGKLVNGKLKVYIPRYHFMRIGKGGNMRSGPIIGTGSTEPKTIVYEIVGDISNLVEGNRYRFEIVDKKEKMVKIVS